MTIEGLLHHFSRSRKKYDELVELDEGAPFGDFVGPLGKEIEEKNYGRGVCVGGALDRHLSKAGH